MSIPIVNKHDEIVGSKERLTLDHEKDIFRSASLWITNSKGDILIAQRKTDKSIDPGKWAEAVGGTVENNDSYEETVIREAAEELGLSNIPIELGPKQYIDSSAKYFVQWYTARIDISLESLVVQYEEIEDVAWISQEQLRFELRYQPDKYISSMKDIFLLLCK